MKLITLLLLIGVALSAQAPQPAPPLKYATEAQKTEYWESRAHAAEARAAAAEAQLLQLQLEKQTNTLGDVLAQAGCTPDQKTGHIICPAAPTPKPEAKK